MNKYLSKAGSATQVLGATLTFNPKGGSLGRLSNTGEHVELHVGAHGLNQADCGGALTFTQRSGRNTANRMTAQVVFKNVKIKEKSA